MNKSKDIEIKKLEFPRNVQEKPGMYISNTNDSTVIVREIIDNSLDEIMNSFADEVNIRLDNKSYWYSVCDNGRGIPIYRDETKKDTEITIDIFGSMHTSGKFDAEEASRGTHGLGASATNALSEDFIVVVNIPRNKSTKALPKWIKTEVDNKKDFYIQHNKNGYLTKKFIAKDYNEVKSYLSSINVSPTIIPDDMNEVSSMVICHPNEKIFTDRKCKYTDRELKLSKMLSPNSKIVFNNEEVQSFDITKDSFSKTKFYEDMIFSIEFTYNNKYDYHGTERESKNKFIVAFGYSSDDFSQGFDGSVNTLDTPDGYHINTVSRMIQKAFKDKFSMMDAKDALYGLRVFVLCITNSAEYTSQSKEKLGRIYGVSIDDLYPLFKKEIFKVYKDNQEYFDSLCRRILEYKETIGALSLKSFVQSKVIYGDDKRSRGLGTDIIDCSSRDRSKCELFLVEGKSSAGCFRAGTLISTLNGDKPIEELTSEDWVLSCTNDGVLTPTRVKASFITKKVSELLKVTLDNGKVIECTENHLFMLRDGSYKEAQYLVPGMSLMPYKTQVYQSDIDNDRPVVYLPDQDYYKYIHRLVGEYYYKNEFLEKTKFYKLQRDLLGVNKARKFIPVFHHIDENPFNNNPENIQLLTSSEHFTHHNTKRNKTDRIKELIRLRGKDPKNQYILDAMNKGRIAFYSNLDNKEKISKIAKRGYLAAKESLDKWNHSKENSEFVSNRNKEIIRKSKQQIFSFLDIPNRISVEELPLLEKDFNNKRKELISNGSISSGLSPSFNIKFLDQNTIILFSLDKINLLPVKQSGKTSILTILKRILTKCTDIPYGSNSLTLGEIFSIINKCNKHIQVSSQKLSFSYRVLYGILYCLLTVENHKVFSIERVQLPNIEPVYDIEVESDNHNFPLSAGVFVHNSMVLARDHKTVSVLPLRGKILNTSGMEIDEALKNREILSMINGIGVGLGEFTDLSKARYGKVIIASDADIDGLHIQVLILAAFVTHLPKVIEAGMLYIALAPLFEQTLNGKRVYLWDESQINRRSKVIRYKGLGSCPKYTLKDTILNPDTRRLIQVTTENLEETISLLLSGELRKQLMVEAKILDLGKYDSSIDIVDYELDELDPEELERIQSLELNTLSTESQVNESNE